MKKVYVFDENTGEYRGEYFAQESPLEPGVYITPQSSTIKEPPVVQPGFYAKFVGGEWVELEDPRGVWYNEDGSSFEVTSLTEEINPASSRIKPVTEEDLILKAKIEKQTQLNSIVVVTSTGKSFDGNESARLNMSNALTVAGFTGQTSSPWKLADNSVVEVTILEIQEALTLSIQQVGVIVGATT